MFNIVIIGLSKAIKKKKKKKNRVTDAELSQVTLLSVAQPNMLPATHATKTGL